MYRLIVILVLAGGAAQGAEEDGAVRMWRTHVEPLFRQYCFKCHGEEKQKSGLDLRTPGSVLKGGLNGPVLVPGKPGDSLLYQSLLPGAETRMPPKDHQLGSAETDLVKLWIAGLAPGPEGATMLSRMSAEWDASGYDLVRPNQPQTVPPPGHDGERAIDFYVDRALAGQSIQPAPRCDDRTFVRRVYLDLLGRIPFPEEQAAFLKSPRRTRREALVDSLLATPEHARHLKQVFDVVLMHRKGGKALEKREKNRWLAYLEWSFRENRPWDTLVREILLARPDTPETRPAVWFQYERDDKHQALVESISPALFGVQVQCAQCHNHPLAPEILQKHYWAMVAFFNRSKNVQTPDGPALSESAVGGFISFANLKKESKPAELTFLNNITIPEKRPKKNEKEPDAADKYVVPGGGKDSVVAAIPKFSRRAEFTKWAVEDNPMLARAFVNRIWALLMGRGLVHPVDRMDSSHPPSHPDLLMWLAREFETHGYDIRRLIRMLVLTETYQRSSAWDGPGPAPQPGTFARALEKPLSAEALFRSLQVASGNGADETGKYAGWDEHAGTFMRLYPDLFAEEYSPRLHQALFLANNKVIEDMFAPREGNTTQRLLETPGLRRRVKLAFETVLGREPDVTELRAALQFLGAREAEVGIRQFLWAMATSAEFMLNH